MVTLEMVEKLRKHANVSYEEAKRALEETDGDILEAIVKLEKENRIKKPEGGGYYDSKDDFRNGEDYNNDYHNTSSNKSESQTFGEMLGRFFRWAGRIINRGNKNTIEFAKDGEHIFAVPVTVFVLLMILAFWVIIPLMIVGLFFGYRYSFKGPDLGKENINRAMDSVADAAENLKKEVRGDKSNGEDSSN